MARKQIILLVVEGPSDQTALEAVFERIFNRTRIQFYVMHDDLTADMNLRKTPQDAIKGARKTFLTQHKVDGFKEKDIKKVILLSDTDGCFIEDQYIVNDSRYPGKFFYEEHCIRSSRINDVKKRNQIKSQRMRMLCGKNEIAGKPFEHYYMSCNLDHVLYGKNNLIDLRKEEEALAAALKYADDPEAFVNEIVLALFPAQSKSYERSWKFIQEGIHSLSRCTNLIWFLFRNNEDLDPSIRAIVMEWYLEQQSDGATDRS